MKRCIYCVEEIQDEAVKCKHCGSILPSANPSRPEEDEDFNFVNPKRECVSDPFDNPDRLTRTNLDKGMLIGGRYLVKYRLGKGGMGEVYLAEDTKLAGEKLAIKVLPDRLSEDIKAVNRLKEEARLAMKLGHKNIVKLHNYEQSGKTHYLVMEYVNGIDLNTYIGVKGRISEESARRVGIEIAQALQAAHGSEPAIVHRDIKPANILLEWGELNLKNIKSKGTNIQKEDIPDIDTARVKLADFGIARQVRDSMSALGALPDTSGTLLYMSPEQIRGKGIDTRTDLYSLGAMLYELLSGDPPFVGEALREQIFQENPEPISGISDELNAILMKLLEKDKEKRYANTNELIEHLKHGIYCLPNEDIVDPFRRKGRYTKEVRSKSEEILKKKSEQAIQYFKKGEECRKKGEHKLADENYSRAIEDYSKAIELSPGKAELYHYRGFAWMKKARYGHAIEDYKKALEINPEYIQAYKDLKYALIMRDDRSMNVTFCNDSIETTIMYISEDIELHPEDATGYLRRGYIYYLDESYELAIEDYGRAIKLNPHCAAAYNERGLVWVAKKSYGRAIADFNKALELEPGCTEAINNKANAQKFKNDSERTIY